MTRTLAYCLTIIAVSIVFDAVMYAREGWTGTISYLVLAKSRRYPIIAFAVGVLIGHLFWPQPEPKEDQEQPQ